MAKTNEDVTLRTKLLDEATKLLADIALNPSGYTSEHANRVSDFITKAMKHDATRVALPLAA